MLTDEVEQTAEQISAMAGPFPHGAWVLLEQLGHQYKALRVAELALANELDRLLEQKGALAIQDTLASDLCGDVFEVGSQVRQADP